MARTGLCGHDLGAVRSQAEALLAANFLETITLTGTRV